MQAEGRSELDDRVREAMARDGASSAVTLLIDALGSELLGYLWVAAGSWGDGDEMFSELCLRLWKGLPGFRFESGVRTWCYVIARNLVRTSATRTRRRNEVMPLSESPDLAERVAAIRTSTYAQMEPQARERLEQLRRTLSESDRTILVLRVDRRMAWRDIAEVMADDGDREFDRLAARLRKRFERIKEQLRREVLGADG